MHDTQTSDTHFRRESPFDNYMLVRDSPLDNYMLGRDSPLDNCMLVRDSPLHNYMLVPSTILPCLFIPASFCNYKKRAMDRHLLFFKAVT